MANRRSLSAALEMSPEQRAFIYGSVTTLTTERPRTDTPQSPDPDDSQPKPVATHSTPTIVNTATEMPRRLPASSSKPRKRAEKMLLDDDSIVWIAQMLVPLTTRLQPATAAALKRAGIEQKLRGQKPGTVQEIAEAALQRWLLECGYL